MLTLIRPLEHWFLNKQEDWDSELWYEIYHNGRIFFRERGFMNSDALVNKEFPTGFWLDLKSTTAGRTKIDYSKYNKYIYIKENNQS